MWLLLPIDYSNNYRTAALVLWTLWEGFVLCFILQYVELIYVVCKAIQFASKDLIKNKIFLIDEKLCKLMHVSCTLILAIQNYLFGYISVFSLHKCSLKYKYLFYKVIKGLYYCLYVVLFNLSETDMYVVNMMARLTFYHLHYLFSEVFSKNYRSNNKSSGACYVIMWILVLVVTQCMKISLQEMYNERIIAHMLHHIINM